MTTTNRIKSILRSSVLVCCALAFFLHHWSASIIQLDFQIHRETVVSLFCVNKESPELQCEGQCHLDKQLKSDESHKNETNSTKVEISTTVLAPVSLNSQSLQFSEAQTAHRTLYLMEAYSVYPAPPFHPPGV